MNSIVVLEHPDARDLQTFWFLQPQRVETKSSNQVKAVWLPDSLVQLMGKVISGADVGLLL